MAERRMIAKCIIESDRFLSLSFAAQALYIHLIVAADDDGFVSNPIGITRLTTATDQHLEELIHAGFVISFPERGTVVITDWRNQNKIRTDRYHPTIYVAEAKQLFIDNGRYSLSPKDGDKTLADNIMSTNAQPNGDQRLSEERQDKTNKEETNVSKGSIALLSPADVSFYISKGFEIAALAEAESRSYKRGKPEPTYCKKILTAWEREQLFTLDKINMADPDKANYPQNESSYATKEDLRKNALALEKIRAG